MNHKAKLSTIFAVAVIFASAAFAVDGRIPIHGSTVISSPGHYYLTRDIGSTSSPVIDINSDTVTLDLNGHTISSTSTTNNIIDFSGYTGITIENGTIKGGSSGVYSYSSSIRMGAVIKDLRIEEADDYGIYLSGIQNIEITDCLIKNITDSFGIMVYGYSETFAGKIENNIVDTTGGIGIYLYGPASTSIKNNNVFNAATSGSFDGIYITSASSWDAGSNIIINNTVDTAGDDGIAVRYADGNIIEGNIIRNCVGDGFYISSSDGNLIDGNVIKSSGSDGLELYSSYRNLIRDNQCEGNGGYGLFLGGTTNHYRSNMLLNNASGAVSGGTDAGGNIM